MGTGEMLILTILPFLAIVLFIGIGVYLIRLLKRLVIAAEKLAERDKK